MNALNEYELRVLASMVEKQIATPDYYPLTLNALMNACNQKNHRDPVVSYDETTVQRALDGLRDRHLAYTFHGSESRTVKYGHVFPKSYELNAEETAILSVLILRGPQTPGELRSRSGHLHQFESLARVEELLADLSSRDEPLVVRMPRQPNSRESRYAHLLGGEIESDPVAVERIDGIDRSLRGAGRSVVDGSRVEALEKEVVALRADVDTLRGLFDTFRKQFE